MDSSNNFRWAPRDDTSPAEHYNATVEAGLGDENKATRKRPAPRFGGPRRRSYEQPATVGEFDTSSNALHFPSFDYRPDYQSYHAQEFGRVPPYGLRAPVTTKQISNHEAAQQLHSAEKPLMPMNVNWTHPQSRVPENFAPSTQNSSNINLQLSNNPLAVSPFHQQSGIDDLRAPGYQNPFAFSTQVHFAPQEPRVSIQQHNPHQHEQITRSMQPPNSQLGPALKVPHPNGHTGVVSFPFHSSTSMRDSTAFEADDNEDSERPSSFEIGKDEEYNDQQESVNPSSGGEESGFDSIVSSSALPGETLLFKSTEEAVRVVHRRIKFEVKTDDVDAVKTNKDEYLIQLKRALYSDGYADLPDVKRKGPNATLLTDDQKSEWIRFQNKHARLVKHALKFRRIEQGAERQVRLLFDEIIKVHELGYLPSGIKPNTTALCSARFNEILQNLRDLAVVRYNLLFGKEIEDLAGNPWKSVARKLTNLMGNLTKKSKMKQGQEEQRSKTRVDVESGGNEPSVRRSASGKQEGTLMAVLKHYYSQQEIREMLKAEKIPSMDREGAGEMLEADGTPYTSNDGMDDENEDLRAVASRDKKRTRSHVQAAEESVSAKRRRAPRKMQAKASTAQGSATAKGLLVGRSTRTSDTHGLHKLVDSAEDAEGVAAADGVGALPAAENTEAGTDPGPRHVADEVANFSTMITASSVEADLYTGVGPSRAQSLMSRDHGIVSDGFREGQSGGTRLGEDATAAVEEFENDPELPMTGGEVLDIWQGMGFEDSEIGIALWSGSKGLGWR